MSLRVMFLAALVGLALATTSASGGAVGPGFSKEFVPDTIGPGSVSMLVFTIDNSEGETPVTDLAFADTLPGGVSLAAPAFVSNGCSGIVTAPDGGDTISLAGGTLGAHQTCEIVVNVTAGAIDGVDTTYMNTSGDLTSSVGNSGAATDDLMVDVDRPGFSKSFSPSTVPVGTRSTLTFLIDNTQNDLAAATLQFADTLPVGLVIAEPADASTDCGHPLIPATLTATPGTNVIDLFANGTGAFPALGSGSSCSVVVDVVPTGAGALGNVSGELIATVGVSSLSSGKAAAVLTVTRDPLTLVKEFTNDAVPPGATVNLRFTITNFDRDFAATGVSFTDDLSAALMGLSALGTPLADPCGFGSTLSGTSTLSLTGGNLGPGETCQFDVTLQVPAGAAPGVYTNTTSSISGDVGGSGVTGGPGSDDLFVEAAPILTKTFTDDPVTAGATVTLQFTIANTADSEATDITFSDTFNEVIVSDSMLPADGFCGMGSTADFSDLNPAASPPNAVLTVSGASLAPAGMCTFSVVLNVAPGASTGTYPNATSVVTATVNEATVTGNPARDDLQIVAAPLLIKEFTDDPALAGGTVTLQFTLEHSDEAPGDATGIAFSDDLNATLAGLSAVGLPMNDICGAGSSISGTTNLSFTGGTLSPGASCTFSVTLQVPDPAPAGDHTNTTSSVSATVSGVMASSAPATDDLNIASLLFSKSFTNDPALPGGTVRLEFTINNVGPDEATGLVFTDNLNDALAGLAATGLPMSDICGMGSSLTGASGNTFLIFTAPSLNSGQMCTFGVNLQVPGGAADGVYNNATSNLTATIGGGGMAIPPATDRLTVDSSRLLFTKEFTNDPVPPGGTVNLRFEITNLDGANSASGIAFTDNLDAALTGLAATGLPIAGCGGTVSGTDTISLTGGSLDPGASCFFNVTVSVPPGAPLGTVVSNATSQVTATIGGLPVSGDPAVADLLIQYIVFTKEFDGPTVAGGTPVLTFTLQNLDTVNPVSSLAFSDNLGAALTGLAAVGLPLANPCGAGSQIAGTTVLSFTGGNLPAGGMCSFNVALQVPAGAAPGAYTNTTGALSAGGIQVSVPAADDLSVEPPPAFSKTFSPDSVGVGFNSVLTFTINNGDSAVAANNLAFTDNLPAGIVVAGTPNPSTTCGAGVVTATPGSSVISFSGGSVGADGSCTVQVTVTATVPGLLLNVSGNLTSSSGDSGTASDTLTVNPPPGFDKSFSPNPINPGGTSTLTFTIDNTASSVNASSLDFTDNLPAPVVIANPPNAARSCTGGTLTAVAGSGVFSYSGGAVANGVTCTVTVNVTSDTPGMHLNTSGNLTSSLGDSGTASDTLTVNPPPDFSKEFSPNPINPGGISILTFTIDNSDSTVPAALNPDGPFAVNGSPKRGLAGNLSFTDTLPAEIVIATPAMASTTCGGGTLTAPDGGSTISYDGGMVGAGATCTVTVRVTSSVPGSHLNTSSELTSAIGTSGPAQDTLTVTPFGPVLTKSFTDDPLRPGDLGTLRFTLMNPNDAETAANIAFTDDLNATLAGLTASDVGGGVDERGDPLPVDNPCGVGSQLTGGPTVALTGGILGPGASCSFIVRILVPQGAVPGMYPNATSPVASTVDDVPTESPGAQDTLQIEAPPAQPLEILKTTSTPVVVVGDMASFNISLRNIGASTLTEISVDDPLSPDCNRVVGTLAASASFSYACQSPALAADLTNEATATATPTAGEPFSVSDTALVEVVAASIAIDKTALTPQIEEGQPATFRITITNLTEGTLTGLEVVDPLTLTCARDAGELDPLGPMESTFYDCSTDPLFADFTNTATVTADGGLSATDSATIDVINLIEFTKEPVEQQIDAGQRAEFMITVRNPSSEERTNLVVSDPLTPECDRMIASLAANGGEVTYACGLDSVFGGFTNVATLTLQISGETVTRTASASVTVRNPEVEILKTATASVIQAGQRAEFTITINNISPSVKTNLQVSDPLTPDCDRSPAELGDLPIGGTISYTCMTERLFADLTNVATLTANVGAVPTGGAATASAVGPQGPAAVVTAMATAQVTVLAPQLEIVKTPAATRVDPGQTVQFTITIRNLGMQDISNITVSDPATPACDATLTGVILMPGDTTSYMCTTGPLSATLVNTATVNGDLATGDPLTDSDTATVDVRFVPGDVENIPTLSEWGMAALFCLLAGAGLWMMRRRERA